MTYTTLRSKTFADQPNREIIVFRGWLILRYFAGEEKMKVNFFLLFVYFQSISITVLFFVFNFRKKVHGKSNN